MQLGLLLLNTLDLAFYNLNNVTIENAINTAAANGVEIRYIAEASNANLGINNLDSSNSIYIEPMVKDQVCNKVVIGDRDYPKNAFVLTGSANMTTANLNTDEIMSLF